jgi:hypothetical protein
MAKDILCTFASSAESGSKRGIAVLLEVDRRNIKKAIDRRMLIDLGQNPKETIFFPNRKDIVNHQEGTKD